MRAILIAIALVALPLLAASPALARPPTVYEVPSLQRALDLDALAQRAQGNVASKGELARRQARQVRAEEVTSSPVVQTTLGAVQGYTDLLTGVHVWRGIPYAAPPTGDFRLRAPQPGNPWNGTRSTILQGPICPQLHITDWLFLGNEDCLTINVYVPAGTNSSSALPVFAWIYGGAYVLGDSDEFGLYDGVNMAATRQHVVVTFNYRLGPLGFMANDALRAESGNGIAGNMALLDQVAALQWIQQNIAAFGGDNSRVTIAGESAGAFSVCWHLASPLSTGLFHAAILESGTCDSAPFFSTYETSRNWTNTYINMIGCDADSPDVLTCLRNLPTGKIMGDIIQSHTGDVRENVRQMREAYEKSVAVNSKWDYLPLLFPLMSWGTTIDGVSLTDVPLNVIASGNYNKVPVIMGSNDNEGTIFVPMMPLIINGVHFPVQESDLSVAMSYFFEANATIVNGIATEYPLANYQSPEDQFNSILRDYMFVCPSRRALKAMAAANASVWLYHWQYKGDWIEDWLLGDYHSAELEFVWDNQWPPIIHMFSPTDSAMANTVDTYWSNHVTYLNPNGPATESRTGALNDEEYWPPYDPVQQMDMVLAVPTRVEQDYYSTQCDFWDSVDEYNRIGKAANKFEAIKKAAREASQDAVKAKKPAKIILKEF